MATFLHLSTQSIYNFSLHHQIIYSLKTLLFFLDFSVTRTKPSLQTSRCLSVTFSFPAPPILFPLLYHPSIFPHVNFAHVSLYLPFTPCSDQYFHGLFHFPQCVCIFRRMIISSSFPKNSVFQVIQSIFYPFIYYTHLFSLLLLLSLLVPNPLKFSLNFFPILIGDSV